MIDPNKLTSTNPGHWNYRFEEEQRGPIPTNFLDSVADKLRKNDLVWLEGPHTDSPSHLLEVTSVQRGKVAFNEKTEDSEDDEGETHDLYLLAKSQINGFRRRLRG